MIAPRSELASVAASGVVLGVVLGFVVFGGLRWTTARLVSARRPGRLLIGSAVLRTVVVGTAMVVLARIGPVALVSGLVGLLTVRSMFVRLAFVRPSGALDQVEGVGER